MNEELVKILKMIENKIFLKTLEDVKSFVKLAMNKEYSMELKSGKYVVNAKSIMGIFGLDLSKPLQIEVSENCPADFKERLKEFSIAAEAV